MTTVIWIDWYSYHVSRFRALLEHRSFNRNVTGIELVGGCGVHSGFKFRDEDREGLPIASLFPDADWNQTGQIKLARATWRKLNEINPSAVLVPGWYTAPAFAAAIWAKLHGRRSILMSETTEQDHVRVWWKETIKSILVRNLFDFAVAGGKPHVRYLVQLGFPAAKIAHFYDVVDNHFYQAEADRVRQSVERKAEARLPDHYFLYVGRLAPEKNLEICLRAFKEYRQKGGTWSLVLVGDGPERGLLEQTSNDLGVASHVLFAGFKTSKETSIYYAFASCFILPSSREPWGLVVNEAMASGLPILASARCGCVEDLVEPDGNGYLFDPLSQNEITTQMLRVEQLGEAELRGMGKRSLQIIAHYSPQNWANEVARLVHHDSAKPSLVQPPLVHGGR